MLASVEGSNTDADNRGAMRLSTAHISQLASSSRDHSNPVARKLIRSGEPENETSLGFRLD